MADHAYHQTAITDKGEARPILADLLGSLGEGAFVKPPLYGAGAVVTRDIPANVVAVGNPARVLREI
jgi:hypothetical protein